VVLIQKRLRLKRQMAIATVFVALLAVLTFVLWQLVPTVIAQTSTFVQKAPTAIDSIKQLGIVTSLDNQFGGSISNAINSASQFLADAKNWPTMLGGVVQVGLNVFSGFLGAIIVIILTLYFMSSMDRFMAYIYSLVPTSKRKTFQSLAEQIANSIGRYVMGQTTIALINATCGFIMMSIVGVPFSLVLTCITFGLALIPLVGSISGAAIVVVFALAQSPTAALVAGIYYLVYMQIESYVLAPRIMSKAVAVPSAVIMVAALAGGALLGVLGALVAIPVAASIILIIRQVWVPRQEKL